MKNIALLFISFLCVAFLGGCQNVNEHYLLEEELGAYSFGFLFDVEMTEIIRFVYNGEAIRIPYHVEGLALTVISEIGWFLFVDGLPQRTHLETKEGEIFSETSYIHNFALSYHEKIEFYVVFTPISGEVGETVTMVAGSVFRPEFMPDDINDPIFGIFHALSVGMPAEIEINSETVGSFTRDTSTQLQTIPQEILYEEQVRLPEGMGLDFALAQFPRIGMFPHNSNIQLNYEGVIFAESGQAKVSLFVYGGQEVTSRITFFVNHQPVQVNDVDFIEVQMEHGQMALVNIELSLDEPDHLNALYAVMMTIDDDSLQRIFKTSTLLLVNE